MKVRVVRWTCSTERMFVGLGDFSSLRKIKLLCFLWGFFFKLISAVLKAKWINVQPPEQEK